MKKLILLFALVGGNAYAENIPVRIACQTANGGFVQSASQSMGSPYYYDKKTLLVAGTAQNSSVYIIQNENFDLAVGTAHLTGMSHTNGYSDAFDLMINFSSGQGTFRYGAKKVSLTNCRATKW